MQLQVGTRFTAYDFPVRKQYNDPGSGEMKTLYAFHSSEVHVLVHALSQAAAWVWEARAQQTTSIPSRKRLCSCHGQVLHPLAMREGALSETIIHCLFRLRAARAPMARNYYPDCRSWVSSFPEVGSTAGSCAVLFLRS